MSSFSRSLKGCPEWEAVALTQAPEPERWWEVN